MDAQLSFSDITKEPPRRGGPRRGAGRKRKGTGRPNVAHGVRPPHKGRFPVHVTMRGHRRLPALRSEVVQNTLRRVLERQAKRAYSAQFQVVDFSIQDDHLHLIVEAVGAGDARDERDMLRRGIAGLAISFARQVNKVLRRKGKVWGDRHHRRDLESPTEVRNTILYVLQNWRRHGVRVFGAGVVDHFSTATRGGMWSDTPRTVHEAIPWAPRPRTWLLGLGWRRAGPLHTFDLPPAADGSRMAAIVRDYLPASRPG